MSKPILLDGFCGAGGCTRGYQEAGFYVVGIDIKPQPHYIGDEFFQGDALEFIARHGHEFDVIHVSPPCQKYSVTAPLSRGNHPDLVDITRVVLLRTKKPYIIENVPGAPLINPLMLCGTMFNLRTRRHRLFETSPSIWFPPASCNHWGKSTGNAHNPGTKTRSINDGFAFLTVVGHDFLVEEAREAMGIDWMTRDEISQAIPPAYTKWLGEQILKEIGGKNCDDLNYSWYYSNIG